MPSGCSATVWSFAFSSDSGYLARIQNQPPGPGQLGDLYVRELFKDDFSFVAREADPAVREKDVPLRAIDTGDMLLLEEGHCLRDHAIAACGPRRGTSSPRRVRG